MPTQFTFRSACEFIKEKHANEPKLIDAADALLGTAMVLSPVVFGPIAAPVLALLGVKNELVKVGKHVYDTMTATKDDDDDDVLLRYKRLGYTYCFVCYAAFFDALDEVLSQVRKDIISLADKDKLRLSDDIVSQFATNTTNEERQFCELASTAERPIHLPHPTENFDHQCNQLNSLYDEMAKGAARIIESTAAWATADEKSRETAGKEIRRLPEAARSHFKAYYLDLSLKSEEFCVWANQHDNSVVIDTLSEQSRFVQQSVELARSQKNRIDIGLTRLEDAVESLPGRFDQQHAVDVLEGLQKTYANMIDQPIIDDRFVDDNGKVGLRFPQKKDIFIPQSYRVLRVVNPKLHLDDETTWKGVESQDTLASFIFQYLNSPYSLESILIVLGHPGSGKSLLTEILAARLESPKINSFRVELRDIDAESEIDTQIETQIQSDTGREIKWAKLSDELQNPPLVILDGYDELLQASGRVFRNYLVKVHKFQEREFVQKRPVRVIITSRITLIDKAVLPKDTTIVRLEEFDRIQQEKWIQIWNATNSHYFADGLRPFTLSDHEELRRLAAQPLLLLMLALYDSDANQLHKDQGLNETLLYNNLLKRFVERECRKGEAGTEYASRSNERREEEVDVDMHRLGVAAIGMFNRRTLHILTRQLNDDLKFFQLERAPRETEGGEAMAQADLLLGSFFFIHESKNRRASDGAESEEVTGAFEFLHNTFGEFLTADFILRAVFSETQRLADHELNPRLQAQMLEQLDGVEAFPAKWYGCLSFAALHTRPKIVEMLSADHS